MQGDLTTEDLRQELLASCDLAALAEVAGALGVSIPETATAGEVADLLMQQVPLDRLVEEMVRREAGSAAPAAAGGGDGEVDGITPEALRTELETNWTDEQLRSLASHFGVEVESLRSVPDLAEKIVAEVPTGTLVEELMRRETERAGNAGSPGPDEGADEGAADPATAGEPAPRPAPAPVTSPKSETVAEAENYDDSNLLRELRSMRRDTELDEDSVDPVESEGGAARLATFVVVVIVSFGLMWFVNPTFRTQVLGLLGRPPATDIPGEPSTDPSSATTGAIDPAAATTSPAEATPGTGPTTGSTVVPIPTPAGATVVVPATPAVTTAPVSVASPIPSRKPPAVTPKPSPTPRPPTPPAVTPKPSRLPESPTPSAPVPAPSPAATPVSTAPPATTAPVPATPAVTAPVAAVAEAKRLADDLTTQGQEAQLDGDRARAIAKYEGALREAPAGWEGAEEVVKRLAVLRLEVGEVAFLEGRIDEAVTSLRRSVELAPTSKAYLYLGRSLERKKVFPEALASYAKAVALDPTNGRAHYYLAYAYRAQGLFPEAEREAALAEKYGEVLDPGFKVLLRYRPGGSP